MDTWKPRSKSKMGLPWWFPLPDKVVEQATCRSREQRAADFFCFFPCPKRTPQPVQQAVVVGGWSIPPGLFKVPSFTVLGKSVGVLFAWLCSFLIRSGKQTSFRYHAKSREVRTTLALGPVREACLAPCSVGFLSLPCEAAQKRCNAQTGSLRVGKQIQVWRWVKTLYPW